MKKNILIVILVIIILCLGVYVVYDKVIEKEEKENVNKNEVNDVLDDSQNEVTEEEKETIEFTGDKNTEVTYNPSYAPSYNLNYKINEDGKLVFIDINNPSNTMTYASIKENCKYVVMSIPQGKQEPFYEIAVITTDGKIYYKEFYAWAEISDENGNQYASMNDNFKKIESNINFNGISVKENILESEFSTIVINSIDNKEYYITSENFENITLNSLN